MTVLIILFLCLPMFTATAGDPTAAYDAALARHVHNGRVDYKALKDDDRLGQYIRYVSRTDPATLPSKQAKLAFWINAYNAWTLKIVCDHYPLSSIKDLAVQSNGKSVSVWDRPLATVGGQTMTLNGIEHDIIRAKFDEPRIHFALVCAARSCPPLRPEAYTAQRLDVQLSDQARIFLQDRPKNSFDVQKKIAYLSQLFDWYADDFGGKGEPLLRYLAAYAPADAARSLKSEAHNWQIRFTDYDWSLND